MDIALQTMLLMLFIGGASFFAGSETGFVSWNPMKIEHRAVSGDIVAQWALFLLKRKDRLLSAQLIGNNICVIGASLAFASLFETIDRAVPLELTRMPSPESWLLTPVIVLFSEMLPKSLYRLYPFILTMRSVPVLMIVYFITLPFTIIFSAATDLFRKNSLPKGDSFMTKVREEMVLIALEGSKIGTLFKSADVFIQNILALNEKSVGEVFPRVMEEDTAINENRFFSNELVGEVKKRVPDQPGILVYNPVGNSICGYISLFTLIQAPEEATLENYCRGLPQLETGQTLFAALRSADEGNHYCVIGDQNENSNVIIDKMMLMQAAFNNKKTKYQKL